MDTKKETARVLQHQDGGEQIGLDGFEGLPDSHPIINWQPPQGSIAAFVPRGRTHALRTRELAKITGQTPWEVTRRICVERRAGAPILSDPGAGFWLAESAEELLRCSAALRRRAREICRTARALENYVRRQKDE